MASVQATGRPTVPQLMRTVKELAPAQLNDFKRRFAHWQQQNGGRDEEQAALVQTCQARLPAPDERRLRRLIAKSERRRLSAAELEDYRALVGQAERLDATRLAALTELARRWSKPVQVVMATIGWEAGEDETASHPARSAKTSARSRG